MVKECCHFTLILISSNDQLLFPGSGQEVSVPPQSQSKLCLLFPNFAWQMFLLLVFIISNFNCSLFPNFTDATPQKGTSLFATFSFLFFFFFFSPFFLFLIFFYLLIICLFVNLFIKVLSLNKIITLMFRPDLIFVNTFSVYFVLFLLIEFFDMGLPKEKKRFCFLNNHQDRFL